MNSPRSQLLKLLVAFFALIGDGPFAYANTSPLPAWPVQIRQQMSQLADIEWRIRRAAGGSCPSQASGAGIIFDYIGAYDPQTWDILRSELEMSDLPQIAAVATDSPAATAGVKTGDELIAIGDVSVDAIYAKSANKAILADEISEIMGNLPPGKRVTLTLKRKGTVIHKQVRPVPICGARVILISNRSIDAYSDDRNIAVTTGMVAFAANADELALIVGHELAHVILRHDDAGDIGDRRRMEDDADLVGAELARCAGYDVRSGAAFWSRYQRQDELSWLRLPTHRSSREREARIREAADSIACPFTPKAAEQEAPR